MTKSYKVGKVKIALNYHAVAQRKSQILSICRANKSVIFINRQMERKAIFRKVEENK